MRIFGFNASCLLLVLAHLKITKSEGTILSPCTLPTKPPNHRTCLKLQRLSSGTQLCLPNPFRAKRKQIVFIWEAEAFGRKKIPSTVLSRRCVWAKTVRPHTNPTSSKAQEGRRRITSGSMLFIFYQLLLSYSTFVQRKSFAVYKHRQNHSFFFTFVDRKTESKVVCYLWTFRLRLM